MKLIKKIAAIMFAFMMVFSLSTNAKADEGTGSTGSIKVNNAANGQDYTLYRILDLVSSAPDTESHDPDDNGIYSYKPNGNWINFLNNESPEGGKQYITINKDGYADWKGDKSEARRAEFAKKALAWAKAHKNDTNSKTKINPVITLPASNNQVVFDSLELGYYLVDSSVGALCTLTTTNPTIEVEEKNETPVLEKRVNKFLGMYNHCSNKDLVKYSTANYGQVVNFTITIKNLKGAENFNLKDTMGEGFDFYLNKNNDTFSVHMSLVNKNKADTGVDFDDNTNIIGLTENNDYTLKTNRDNKSFEISFTEDGYKKIKSNPDYILRISYSAVINKNATINNTNTATLTYGDKGTTTDQAYVGTLHIPVFKYTSKLVGQETPLAGAEFTLYNKDEEAIKFSKGVGENTYNYDENVIETATLTSDENGNIEIKGLAEGTYYLKETKAPKGYNLLKDRIQVTITPIVKDTTQEITGQKLTVLEKEKENEYAKVKVLNNSGSLLPSTGGMGTTLIYLVGGALVLGSGFVLANKKRAKAK